MHHPSKDPSRIAAGVALRADAVDVSRSYAFTVAGTVPDFHRIPY